MQGAEHTSQASKSSRLEADLLGSISEILDTLQRVGKGDALEALELRYPDTHPVGALTLSVNAMIESLTEARQRSRAYSRELQEKLDAIARQQAAIQELSTPILEVWRGVLCLPIIGIVDSSRTADMARMLLGAIIRTKAAHAVIDITGVQVMDTRVVDHFLRMARAVRLLGAHCVLSGVHPNVSHTMVHMGMDLQGIETHRSLREALRQFITPTLAASKAQRDPVANTPLQTDSG